MTPHHKPKNVTLTRIARLVRGDMSYIKVKTEKNIRVFAEDSFDVSARALDRIRGIA